MLAKKLQKPNIFEYTNYRDFLRDWVEQRKHSGQTFSYRWFSQRAGYSSPNFLKLVIDGKRQISDKSIQLFSHALKLNQSESSYFYNLVKMNQSDTLDSKNLFARELMSHKKRRNIQPLEKDQYNYYSQWYNIPIRELLTLNHKKMTADKIAKKFLYEVPEIKVQNSLNNLKKLGLINKQNYPTDANITTGDNVSSLGVIGYHKSMIKLAAQSIETTHESKRDISSVTLTLSEEKVQMAKQKIQQLRKEILALTESEEKGQAVYQFNFQLFPLTHKLDEDES